MAATPPPQKPIFDQIMQDGKLGRDPEHQAHALDMLNEFITQVTAAAGKGGTDPVAFIQKQIDTKDQQLSKQLDALLHDPKLQKLEATWRGLFFLVMNTETSTHLKLRLMNVQKDELRDDLEKAIEFDQSALFKKVYEEEYGTFGGNPYSCLMVDFDFDTTSPDMSLMGKLTSVAAAAHAPVLAAASPTMFNLDTYADLGKPRDLAKIFESADKIKWKSFREMEDSRYMALFLPRVLMRLPYGPETLPVHGINYEESVDGKTLSTFVWGNPAYMMAQRVNNAFALYGWTAAIRGVEGGGLVEGLPSYTFKTTEGDIALKCPTQIAITDRREKELSDLGFITLCHCKGTDKAAFFGGQTSQKPKKYNLNTATSNANLSARLPYIMAASRFAHYIKVIMRDKVGSFMSRIEVQKYLQTWISEYVLLTDEAPQSLKARFPLREARIDVFDVPGDPGKYRATIFLRPHFQLEELTASIRLVAELPPPAK